MTEKKNIDLEQGIKERTLNEKFKRKIQFLKLNAAAQSKLNFATAKVVLKKFRQVGIIKNSNKEYESQIELLRQIVCIQSEIKQEKIQKREKEYQILCQKLQKIKPLTLKGSQEEIQINIRIRTYQEELKNQEQIQLELVKCVLLEQIKLMKSQQ